MRCVVHHLFQPCPRFLCIYLNELINSIANTVWSGNIQGLSSYTKYVWLKMIPYTFYTSVVRMMLFPTYEPGLYDSINDIDVKHVVVKVVRNAVHVRTMKNTNTHTHTKRETKLWSYSCTYWNIRYTFITLLSYTLTATDGPTNPPTVCACVSLLFGSNEHGFVHAQLHKQYTHQRWICTNLSTISLLVCIFPFRPVNPIFFCCCCCRPLYLRTTIDHCKYRNWQWKKNNFPICLHNGPNPIEKKRYVVVIHIKCEHFRWRCQKWAQFFLLSVFGYCLLHTRSHTHSHTCMLCVVVDVIIYVYILVFLLILALHQVFYRRQTFAIHAKSHDWEPRRRNYHFSVGLVGCFNFISKTIFGFDCTYKHVHIWLFIVLVTTICSKLYMYTHTHTQAHSVTIANIHTTHHITHF